MGIPTAGRSNPGPFLLQSRAGGQGWGLQTGQWPASMMEVADLPLYTFATPEETEMQPCGKAWLGEQALQKILATGLGFNTPGQPNVTPYAAWLCNP